MQIFLRICSVSSAAILLAGLAPGRPAQGPVRRAVPSVDEASVVTLAGNVHPLARPEFDQGALDSATRMDRMLLLLRLTPARQAALDALVEAQQNPASPLYHHWLTPAQYGELFGPSAAELARVTGWLEAQGFRVEEIAASHRLVAFSGTAGQVQGAFHTEIDRYRVGGTTHIANAQNPQIPASLAGIIDGVVSLNNFRHRSEIAARRLLTVPPSLVTGRMRVRTPAAGGPLRAPKTLFTSGSSHYLFPADFATIYDLNPLYAAGTMGLGASIAIAGRSNIKLSDVAAFRMAAGLAAKAPSVVLAGADPGLATGDQDEATLDVEWSGAVAPAASVSLVAAASTATTDGVDLASAYIVNHAVAPVVSVSYGSCEQDMGATELAFYNGLWEQAASEGMSVFVASGDAGAAGCSSGADATGSGAAVNGLCSSPYSTCVGGTEFNEGANPGQYWTAANGMQSASAVQYIPEVAWNESGTNGGTGLWASGGGVSAVYPQPAWQAPVRAAADGMRTVPDVALSAALHDGYIICENGSHWVVSGTSAAAPSFAGLMALVVESRGGVGQGSANQVLYGLLNAEQDPFHPTPSGNNSVPGVSGFTATGAAYNLATGLGSVNGALLVDDWGTASSSADFTMTASASSGTALAGDPVSFALGVTESGPAQNAVSLSASVPAGLSVGFSSSTVLPGAPVTVTVIADAGTPPGTQDVVIAGSDASGTQAITFALTVTEPASLQLSASAKSVMLDNGSGTVGLTAVTGGLFAGEIAFSVSGLPKGITATWSTNPTPLAAGASSTPVTLSLTVTSQIAPGNFAITVTATGDGLSAAQRVTVTVMPPAACRYNLLPSRCNTGGPGRRPVFSGGAPK